jgi:proteic killer suppression protein
MNLPGYRLHPLKGNQAGRYAVDVSGAWRLTFEFDNGDAVVVDYEQYH